MAWFKLSGSEKMQKANGSILRGPSDLSKRTAASRCGSLTDDLAGGVFQFPVAERIDIQRKF
ncbi:MAG: hypothetical protein P1V20_26735 [Verrucomicrobiales bacterium]|nr:hypothetical protein [Verrucomicrobiales bacterium]